MPIYHFNVVDGVSAPDPEGVELTGLDEARIMAVSTAAEIIRQEASSFWHSAEWVMNVTDHSGLTLFELMFIAFDGPAGSKQKSW